MTGLIGSLVGAASTAVERLTGTLQGKAIAGGDDGAAGEFAQLLATMTGAGPAAAAAAARPREFRLGSAATDAAFTGTGATAEEAIAGEASAAETSNAAAALAAAAAQLDPAVVRRAKTNAPIGEVAPLADTENDSAETAEAAESTEVEAVDVTRPATPDTEGLDPEFRRRLDRVVERMEAEFGHSITIVEGLRSQDRQNLLYEQGRTRPGPVVTWTRNSNHLVGRAVDVMIDGTYNNPKGYQRLAQIAAEEGLRTLGARDPGHIELPRGRNVDFRLAAELPPFDAELPQPGRQTGGLARVARVAEVAQVARAADVAQVAQVAEVARVADPLRTAPTTSPSPAAVNPTAGALASSAGLAGGETGHGSGHREGQRESTSPSTAEMEILRGDPGISRSFSNAAVTETGFTGGTDAIQRAAQILAMKEGAANAPINHLLLRIDSPNGGEDRIRVDLRGTNVDTTLNIGNPTEAEQLASKVSELRQSLERHGLEADAVRIRTTQPVVTERVEAARAVYSAAELESARQSSNGRNGSDTSSPRDPWKDSHEQLRREPGDPRQRSRKEQPQEEKA